MGDSASAVHNKIMKNGWMEWGGGRHVDFRKLYRRRVKRKFERVSREEIIEGVDEGEQNGYGKYDEGDLCERDMFFDDLYY